MSSKWTDTKSSIEAWTPSEVRAQKINFIPPEIIEAVNELIAKHWNGSSATISISEVRDAAFTKMRINCSPNLEKNYASEGWLDFEPIFEDRGWHVMFDRPGYCESYDATWRFSPKQKP